MTVLAFPFVCFYLNIIYAAYSAPITCAQLMSHNVVKDSIDAIDLSVSCTSSHAELKWLNKLDSTTEIGLLNIEYTFYNLTSGFNYTEVVSQLTEVRSGSAMIELLEPARPDVFYIFRCCIEDVSAYNIIFWKMNKEFVNCTYKDLVNGSNSSANPDASLFTTLPTAVQSHHLSTRISRSVSKDIKITSTTRMVALASETEVLGLTETNDWPPWGNFILLLAFIAIIVMGAALLGILVLMFTRRKRALLQSHSSSPQNMSSQCHFSSYNHNPDCDTLNSASNEQQFI